MTKDSNDELFRKLDVIGEPEARRGLRNGDFTQGTVPLVERWLDQLPPPPSDWFKRQPETPFDDFSDLHFLRALERARQVVGTDDPNFDAEAYRLAPVEDRIRMLEDYLPNIVVENLETFRLMRFYRAGDAEAIAIVDRWTEDERRQKVGALDEGVGQMLSRQRFDGYRRRRSD